MATDNTAAPNRGIDDVLQQTEMGNFIAKNKAGAIGIIVLILLSVAGFGVWNWLTSQRDVEAQTKIFEFTQGSFKSLTEKKIEAAAFVSAFDRFAQSMDGHISLFAVGIESANVLIAAGNDAEALSVLNKIKPVAKNGYQRFLLATNLAVVYENVGEKEQALLALEELVKANVGIMEAKVYLDIGRLALALGQNDKARSSLQWVIDKGTDAEMTLLARLYLSQLEK